MIDININEPERCDRCGLLGHDRRSLWMACFYAMNELGVPFKEIGVHGQVVEITGRNQWKNPVFAEPNEKEPPVSRSFFTLRVCKGCRAEWMEAIKNWFRAPPGDVSRWNNDESTYGLNDDLPKMIADLARVHGEIRAMEQRAGALESKLWYAQERELKRLDAEDRREPKKKEGDG